MEQQPLTPDDEKIDFLVTVCGQLADILKDPTGASSAGPRKDMTSEARSEARQAAYTDLLSCIDTLAACAQFYCGYSAAINIADKLHSNEQAQQPTTK